MFAHICGYPTPDALVKTISDIGRQMYVDPERREEFSRKVTSNGAIMNFESQIYRRGGQIAWISENAWAVRSADGRILYYEGFLEDITELKLSHLASERRRPADSAAGLTEFRMEFPFDLKVLLRDSVDDRRYCTLLLRKFNDRGADLLAALDRAARSGRPSHLAVQAQMLRRLAHDLAADDLQSAAADLERVAHEGEFERAAVAVERVQAQLERCLRAVPCAMAEVARQSECNAA